MDTSISDPRVTQVFNRIVTRQLELKPDEQVLIVADSATETAKLEALMIAINGTGAVPTLVVQPNSGWAADDPYALTPPVAAAYVDADVVIAATMTSSAALYGRPTAFRELMERKEKVRLFSMCERPLDVIVADSADYHEIKRNNERLKEMLSHAQTVRITGANGTDFKGGCQGVPYEKLWGQLSHEGFALAPGEFGAAPDGETHWPCPPETMEGEVVVDGPIANICSVAPDQPVRISVKRGRITRIEGGRDADKLRRLVADLEQEWVSEIGIGTNPTWIVSESLHGVKKGLGNVHVAYGGWWGFQPDIPYKVHGDMVIYNGRVEIDGEVVMDQGTLFPG